MGINITNVNISGIKTVYCKDRIIKINSGVSHGCFITDKSEAYFFGNNKYEQCLNVSNDTLYKPYKVKWNKNQKIINIHCGGYHSIIIEMIIITLLDITDINSVY